MKPTKVTLSYRANALGDQPYRIDRIINDIGVQITPTSGARILPGSRQAKPERFRVGDFLTEVQATELLTEPGVEVTTVPAKG